MKRARGGWRTRDEREQLGVRARFGQRVTDLANAKVGRRTRPDPRSRIPAARPPAGARERVIRASEGPVGRIITAAILLEAAWLLLRALG